MEILITIPQGAIFDSFIPPALLAQIKSLGTLRLNETGENFSVQELAQQIGNAEVCITGWGSAMFTQQVLANAPKLRLIAHTGGTVAAIAGDAVYNQGIKVLSGNEVYAKSVAEGVIAYILAALRDIPKYAAMVQTQGWSDHNWYTQGLLDQQVGLVGFGTTARYTAKMLKAFDAKVLIASNHLTPEEAAQYGAKKATIEEVFSTCKVVSLHMAATPKTYHQVDATLLALLQDGALLVNTARGSVIDEMALAKALKSKRFKAILDVFETEPLPPESPLRGLDNAILIPHMAGPTIDRRPFVTSSLLEGIKAISKGEGSYLEIGQAAAQRMTR